MDERRDRRRAFHRVGQPDVERHLRRFADCAAEDKQRRVVEIARAFTVSARSMRRRSPERPATGGAPDHENAEHETEVADAIGDKRLVRGRGGESRVNQWPISR